MVFIYTSQGVTVLNQCMKTFSTAQNNNEPTALSSFINCGLLRRHVVLL